MYNNAHTSINLDNVRFIGIIYIYPFFLQNSYW